MKNIAAAYEKLGSFYLKNEQLPEALESYLEALKAAKKLQSPQLTWKCYFALGKIYEKIVILIRHTATIIIP